MEYIKDTFLYGIIYMIEGVFSENKYINEKKQVFV